MTNCEIHYSGNLQKICNMIGPKNWFVVSALTHNFCYLFVSGPMMLWIFKRLVEYYFSLLVILDLQFLSWKPLNSRSHWQCSQYLDLNPTCPKNVWSSRIWPAILFHKIVESIVMYSEISSALNLSTHALIVIVPVAIVNFIVSMFQTENFSHKRWWPKPKVLDAWEPKVSNNKQCHLL